MSENKPALRWGHINLNVSNLERSIEFYSKLGFEVFIPAIPYIGLAAAPGHDPIAEGAATALDVPASATGRACIMQLGDSYPKLDLTEFADLEPSPPLTNRDLGYVRLCLGTETLSEDVARLRGQGVEFISDPQTGHGQLADIAIAKDPDGALIELIQIYPERWQALSAGG